MILQRTLTPIASKSKTEDRMRNKLLKLWKKGKNMGTKGRSQMGASREKTTETFPSACKANGKIGKEKRQFHLRQIGRSKRRGESRCGNEAGKRTTSVSKRFQSFVQDQ